MSILTRFIALKIIGMATAIAVVVPVFAESAPVYEVEAMQQDDSTDQSQYPPPPEEEFGGAFVSPEPASPVAQPSAAPLTMGQRMKRVEQQINNMQNADSTARVESLQAQLQTLRGQVEQLTHQLGQLQEQQKALYADLDKRLSAASATASVPSAGATAVFSASEQASKSTTRTLSAAEKPSKASATTSKVVETTVSQPDVAEEQQIYQTAYNLIKAKKYKDAVDALKNMLKKYPSGQFSSNAHYWLGELYGLMGKNELALAEFQAVLKARPSSPREPDAQLKVGLILASQLQWAEAKAALKKVVNRYPGSASARLAQEQLKQIKQAGH
jgi:tol-pal system protein YbgF